MDDNTISKKWFPGSKWLGKWLFLTQNNDLWHKSGQINQYSLILCFRIQMWLYLGLGAKIEKGYMVNKLIVQIPAGSNLYDTDMQNV